MTQLKHLRLSMWAGDTDFPKDSGVELTILVPLLVFTDGLNNHLLFLFFFVCVLLLFLFKVYFSIISGHTVLH